jgi:hypothetical protein
MKLKRAIVVTPVVLAVAAVAAAQGPLPYTYVDLEWSVDSTVQIYGDAFDSDESWVIGGSLRLSERFFLWGRYGDATYDLREDMEHYFLTLGTLGVGYRLPVRTDPSSPLDFIASLSYEYHDMKLMTQIAEESFSTGGVGLRAGVRAGITRHFELGGYAYWVGYGSSLSTIRDELDGLFFELNTALTVYPWFHLTLTYLTGELDYVELTPIERPIEVEVDRDEIRLGVRFIF